MSDLTHRLATLEDCAAIEELMAASMRVLLPDVLSKEEVAASSASMGLDQSLIKDGTYFLVFSDDALAGCGGWSRRRTLFGGDATVGRDDSLADPSTEAAKIRAMYTHPDHVRKGVGSLILNLAEDAARQEGFQMADLGSTASGILLYEKRGYILIEDVTVADENGVRVPILHMRKAL